MLYLNCTVKHLCAFFKGTVHPNQKYTFLLLINLDSVGVSCLVIWKDFCLLSNIMGLNGALNVALTVPKIENPSTVIS